jgi:hypothetical protein
MIVSSQVGKSDLNFFPDVYRLDIGVRADDIIYFVLKLIYGVILIRAEFDRQSISQYFFKVSITVMLMLLL